MNNNVNKYDLVIKKDRGNYMPINISLLGFSYENLNDIMSIDMFTSRYSKEELLSAIKNANIIPNEYLFGELKIAKLDLNKHKYIVDYPVLTSDYLNGFNLEVYLNNNVKNKVIMNTLRSKYKDILDDKNENFDSEEINAFIDFSKIKEQNIIRKNINDKLLEFDEAKNNNNVNKLLEIIFSLDYIDSRKLCSYIIENKIELKNGKELLREKAA
jgi:hypothetical protein